MIHLPARRSFFLFGARGTGKSTLLRRRFSSERVLWIDLLDPEQEDRYARAPGLLAQEIAAAKPRPKWVAIDEVQKVPRLLDVVHREIESRGPRFALTGSSARRLTQGGANLLAGRAFVHHLFPLTSSELGARFDIHDALAYGTLPGLLSLDGPEEKNSFLRAYGLSYLKEEVWGEQLVRNLAPFRAFLEIAAQTNGEIVNFTNIARDVGADVKTVQSYFQILEDTLLGFMIEPYHPSIRKRQRRAPKFYLFDPGVKRALDRTLTVELRPNTYAFGRAFEHFVVVEAIRRSHYGAKDFRFQYLATPDAEIDLVIERPGRPTALVELKSSARTDERDIRTLARFQGDMKRSEAFCLSLDPRPKKIGAVKLLPWEAGLDEIGLSP